MIFPAHAGNRRPSHSRAKAISRELSLRFLLLSLVTCHLSLLTLSSLANAQKKDEKKDEKKKPAETLKDRARHAGHGIVCPRPDLSPDRKSLLLLAQKPTKTPNLYVMNLTDRSIRPPLTSFRWGAADPAWSPDGQTVALAGFGESGSFAEIYLLDMKTGKLRQMTKNTPSAIKSRSLRPTASIFLHDRRKPAAGRRLRHPARRQDCGGGRQRRLVHRRRNSEHHPGIGEDGKSVMLVRSAKRAAGIRSGSTTLQRQAAARSDRDEVRAHPSLSVQSCGRLAGFMGAGRGRAAGQPVHARFEERQGDGLARP
jgi:hypothetical protein